MALQFIIGASGSGKSFRLYSEVIRHALECPRQTHLVLVPDQFTLQTQKTLVSLSPKKGILNLEVLSFERLAYRIFDELGTDIQDVLEDTGKSLLLRRVCDSLVSELKVLSSGIRKPGFIDEMKSLFSEFEQYDISPTMIGDFLHVENMGAGFKQRMSDIRLIYQTYQKAMEGTYITSEQILTRLAGVCAQSTILKDAWLAFDGYTGFTPVQNILFSEMLSLSEKTFVTVTMDDSERKQGKVISAFSDPYGVFLMSRDFIYAISRIADKQHIAVLPDILMGSGDGKRFSKNGYLAHLEKNLFRERPCMAKKEDLQEANDSVEIYGLADFRDELTFAAASIQQSIHKNPQLRFRDFAVLCPEINDYRYVVEEVFKLYDIPLFVDAKNEALRSSFVELVLSILHLYVSNFSYESVMRYLKCGFSGIEEEDIDLFDNYLLSTGIKGHYRLNRIFDRKAPQISTEELVHLNEIRRQFMIHFEDKNALERENTAEKYTGKLYQIIADLHCEEKLWAEADQLEEAGDHERASERLQIYPKVMELFDKIVRLMGNVVVSLEEYSSIVEEGMRALKIGVIPPSLDSVTFGDMERTRVDGIHTLFCIGFSDARIPKKYEGGGLLLQAERERLQQAGFILAPTDRQRSFMQHFYIYLALCKPKARLVMTYPNSDTEGTMTGSSYLLSHICDLFEGLNIQEISKEELRFLAVSDKALPMCLSDALRDYLDDRLDAGQNKRFIELLAYLKTKNPSTFDMLMDSAGYIHQDVSIPKSVMRAIYGKTLSVSTSRLERYAACAYAYFLEYTLQLKERLDHTFNVIDMGNVYHEALERYAKAIEDADTDWFSVSEDESDRILEKAIEETFRNIRETRFFDSARENYILRRMKRTLRRTIRTLTQQIRKGKFIPRYFEVSLSELSNRDEVYPLDDGGVMKLSGIIDRMDLYETDSAVYVKIIDYKSGGKDISLSDAYEGLQMQLILYLKAVTKAQKSKTNKEVIPAAMFYYQVKDPIVAINETLPVEQIEYLIEKELKVHGLVCDQDSVIAALDQSLMKARENGETFSSTAIPVDVKKNGQYTTASRVLSRDDLAVLGDYVEKKAVTIGEQIMKGNVEIAPYRKQDGTTGCDFCPYHSICGMDNKLEGYRFRSVLEESDSETVLDRMRQELEDAVE